MRHLYIAGVDRWNDYLRGSLSIEQVLTQAVDSCSFSIRGEKPEEGQEVIIEDDALGRLFGGIISRVQLADYAKDAFRVWQVEAQDYTYQLDRRLVVETYQNMAADAIARDIITKYGGGVFTTNHIQTGAPVVEEIIFDYVAPSAALKDLGDYIGWDWMIDYYRDVWFFNPASLGQPAPMTLEPGGYFRNLKHTIDQQGLRNRVYVRGGTMLSDPWTYEVKADGSARAWVLPHKPHDLTITVGGVAKTVGIENVDEESTKDYLVNYQEKYVRCSAQTPTPAAGTTLSFTYRYDIDVITMVEDIASQQAIAAVQGGDGVYEHSIVDDSLTTIDAAEAAGNADLREHANPRVKGSFETEVPGWSPGQLVTINLPDRGIQGTFLVQKVTITPCTPDKWTYRVEYGGRLLGIADWLQALWKAQQKKKLNETALLHKFHYGAETAKVTDEVQGTLRTPPWKVEQSYESLLDITMPGDPTFTRSSVAYTSTGTQVAANVPRYETGKFAQAVMVEEGTQNLFDETKNIADVEVLTETIDGVSTTVYKLDATSNPDFEDFQSDVKYSADPNEVYSIRWKAKWNNRTVFELCCYDSAGTRLADATITKVKDPAPDPNVYQDYEYRITLPANTATCEFFRWWYRNTDDTSIGYIARVQLEEKPYSTSWVPPLGTRSPETLTIPWEYNGGAFCWEGYISPEQARSSLSSWIQLIRAVKGSDYIEIGYRGDHTVKALHAVFYQNGNWRESAGIDIDFSPGDWLFVSLSFDGTTARFGAAKVGQALQFQSFTPTNPNSGSYTIKPNANALGTWKFDDLRISSIARTDAEISAAYSSNAPLPVDEWTTYKLAFDGDLSRYIGFGQQYTTVGGLARVQQLDSNPWPQLQYAMSADGSTWSAWLDVDNKVIDVPYPGYLKVRGAARLPVKVGVRNWKKPFDQTDVVCGFVMAAS